MRVKNTGGWRNEKGNHPRGRLESEVGRDGSSGGESIGVGVGRGEKRRPCVIRDDDGMQRRAIWCWPCLAAKRLRDHRDEGVKYT